LAEEVGSLKAKVSLDTVEFNQGIQTLSKQMSIAREEFKNASGSLDKVKDAMQIAQLKAESLTKQLNVQKKIVEQFREAHKNASEQFGEGSKKALDYELKLKKAEGTLRGLEKQLNSTNDILQKHGMTAAEASKKFQELGITWESTGKKLESIGKTLSIAITAPLLAGAGAGLKFNATMEDFTANFKTMLGSAEKAEAMIADLTEFAKATPFEMTGLADSAKVLLNFGVNAKNVMGTINMLGDVSLGNQEKLGRLTLAFGQIQSTGRLMGQDLNQLINSGFNPLQVISEKTGRSMASLKKDMEAGAISSDMVTEAFKIATSEGGMFYKAMDEGSKTFNGQMSTMKDTVNITLGEVMKPLFTELTKNVLPKVIENIDKMGRAFGSLSEEQKLNILKWGAILAATGPVLLVIGKLITSIPALVTGIKALGVAFTFLAANPIILGIAAIAAAIGLIVYAAGSANREVQKMTASLIESYKKEAEAQEAAIDEAYAVRIDSLDNQLITEEDASRKRMKIIQDEYDAEIKGAGKKEQAIKKSLQERGKALDDAHKKAIDNIRAEYGVFEEKEKSKTDIVQEESERKKKVIDEVFKLSEDIAKQEGKTFEKTYDAILEKAREVHDEKIAMYEQEYLKSIGLINQDLAAKVKGFQDEIDEINNKTKEEDKIKKEQDDRQKILDLRARVNSATNDEDRKKANKNLSDEINEQNRKKELENRKIQIESLNEQIKVAKEKAIEEKNDALIILQNKLSEQKIEIDKDSNYKISLIQKERIEKEKAENAKYDAAKSSIDRQITEMDGYTERYIANLAKELEEKQKTEIAKLEAVKEGIAGEKKAIEEGKKEAKEVVEKATAVKIDTAKLDSLMIQLKKITDKPFWTITSVDLLQRATLSGKIEEEKKRLHEANVPGFAEGVVNWRGGLARVNEKGGEIRYLEKGTTVIPNDISMQIAKSIGEAVGTGGTEGTININVNLIVDGKTLAQVIAPYQYQNGRIRARGQAVTA